jgi:archaellum component FlaG (FlaF/FlaG flagellin family)
MNKIVAFIIVLLLLAFLVPVLSTVAAYLVARMHQP